MSQFHWDDDAEHADPVSDLKSAMDRIRADSIGKPAADPEQPRLMVVTPEQLSEGYLVLYGPVARSYRFEVVRRLADGNYLVKEPRPPGNDE